MLSKFMDDRNFVRDGVVTAGGKIVGLFSPSTIIGQDKNHGYINSRDGIASFNVNDAEQFWAALIKSGAILFGSGQEVAACSAYLKDPRFSRTCSYLSSESLNCGDLLSKLSGISQSSIVIIGCGGIGSLTAMNLVGAGIARITLVDHDTIEESNLNRQFFWTRRDIGLRKVETLQKALVERFADVDVEIRHSELALSDLVALANAHDACVVTADEPLGISAEIANATRTFVVSGSYFHRYASYFVKKTAAKPYAPSIRWTRAANFIAPSFGPANTEIAGAISSACLNYLANRASLEKIDVSQVWRINRLVD